MSNRAPVSVKPIEEVSRAQEIITLHNEIGGYLKISLEKAIRIGELLVEQKDSLKHGGFTSWVKTNLPFTDRTARNYMGLYRERDRLKTETVSDLASGYRLLASPGNRTSLERPWELYYDAKETLSVINDRPLDNDPHDVYLDQAVEAKGEFSKALRSYLHEVDATNDDGRITEEYAWACNVSLEQQNGWAEYRLRCQRKAGQLLSEIKAGQPGFYDFLMANAKKGLLIEACNWLVDSLKERLAQLEAEQG